MKEVTDLLEYKKQKDKALKFLEEDLKKPWKSDSDTLDAVVNLVFQQSELLDTLLKNLVLISNQHRDLQEQVIYLSGQNYLALQIMKEKSLITEEEVAIIWQDVKQKLLPEETKVPEVCQCDDYQKERGHSESCPPGVPRI